MLTRALFLCATILSSVPAAAEVRAVLVGVSDYLHLDADLRGPSQDVALMAGVLMARGVAAGQIAALTSDPALLPDGVTAAAPLRGDILAAMAEVAGASVPGDTVVFYFSGHGSQAPDQNGDEGGGYDEILLPADATGWKGAIGAVENAIVDDELQDWARGLLERGVQVVGLIDACHSATGFRALGGQGVARTLPPGMLGVPDAVENPDAVAADPLPGEFVFLYSSQSDQRSFEYPLGDGDIWHGEFTLRLAEVLDRAPQASWAQVLGAVTEAMVQGPARQQPDGEGPLLSAQVFGTGRAEARHKVDRRRLQAGLLAGLTTGTEVALYAAAAGGEPLAVVTLAGLKAREARLVGEVPAAASWAEVQALAPPPPLRLAAPVRADASDGADYTDWLAALGPASADGFDLVPVLTGGGVALAAGDGVLDPAGPGSSPRISPAPGESVADAVARVLGAAAHALRLRAVLAGSGGKDLLGADPVAVTVDLRAGRPSASGCGPVAEAVPHDPATGVGACDQLWLTIANTSGKAQDVTVLYLAKDFSLTPIWPAAGLSNRLGLGERARAGLQINQGSGAGTEEIWILAVPVEKDAPRTDLSLLATPGATRAAGGGAGIAQWLDARLAPASDGVTSRSFTLRPAPFALIRQIVRLIPDRP